MKHDYTGKFSVGDTVYLNDKSSLSHHRQGTVTEVNLNGKGYPYRVNFGTTHVYHPERELLAELPKPEQAQQWQSMDVDSGLGIGGINNDQAMPFIPSVRAIERVQKMHDTDTICKRCGASANFDGAMFTTLGGSNICDDCA